MCKQRKTDERVLLGDTVSLGLSPTDDKWAHQQREGGCTNPWWRKADEYSSLTVSVAQLSWSQKLRALAKVIDDQPWRDQRTTQICGAFDPLQSTQVCWALWAGRWQPARLIDFGDLPDPGKGAVSKSPTVFFFLQFKHEIHHF